jgi:uncharacterized protein
MSSNRETRAFGFDVERRNAKRGSIGTLRGTAAVFDSPTLIAGAFREQVAPGAFTKALARDDIHALIEHDMGKIIGRNRAGTLRLWEDDHGLRVEIDLPDTQTGRDLMTEIERGDRDQMSFGFRAIRDDWDHRQKVPSRTLQEVELFDVSVVGRGAYDTTDVALRSLEQSRRAANFQAAQLRRRLDLDLRLRRQSKARA